MSRAKVAAALLSTLLLAILPGCGAEEPGAAPGAVPGAAPEAPPPAVTELLLEGSAPWEGIPAEGEAGARAFVDRFLAARLEGAESRAREFLSPGAREQYGESAGGEGTPTLTPRGGGGFADARVVSLNAADANSYEVIVELERRPPGEPVSTVREVLFVGPGPDAAGEQRPWIVRGVARAGEVGG